MKPSSNPELPAFGRRMRLLRRALGIKQSALSDQLGVDQSTVSRWESGAQSPSLATQQEISDLLGATDTDDFALRRLVETSTESVHLIEEVTHKCLAFSKRRSLEWKTARSELLGMSLWRFATAEIQIAEQELVTSDWWSVRLPQPRCFSTSAKQHDELTINAGKILWERLYLADGTPVRLCTSLS